MGGYRMGIFIVAIFLLLIGYLSISIAKISGEKAKEIKKSLENNKENLLEALALGLLMQNDGLIPRVIEKMNLNLKYIISELEKEMSNYPKVEVKVSNENISLDQKTNSILNRAEMIMKEMEDSFFKCRTYF